tara:strand:+ start:4806 stop:5102 length:297 start_codon:yes stop_codon:yes gene_type:complete
MRFVVVDKRGNWQASYSHKIPSYSIKEIKSWAVSTGKLVGGKVLETIVPKDHKYEPHDIVLYDFTHLPNKLQDFHKSPSKTSFNTKGKKSIKKNNKDK